MLNGKFYVDEFYDATVIRLTLAFARLCHWLDRVIWGGVVRGVSWLATALSTCNRALDEIVVNGGFDAGCGGLRGAGNGLGRVQNGQIQRYLLAIGVAFALFVLLLIWGWK